MQYRTIFDQIKTERDAFRSQKIMVVPGTSYLFNQWQTLQRIELYMNSQFEKGPIDPEGYDKYFYNIVRPVTFTARKAIDLDTKDIRAIADDDTSDLEVWFMTKELRQYLRDTKFGSFLNQVGDQFPKYGSVVSKRVGGVHMPVNLFTLINDQRADNLLSSPYITEEHEYTVADIARLSREMPWQNMNLLLDRAMENQDQTVKVYETRHIGPTYWFDPKQDKNSDLTWGMCIIADIDKVTKVETDEAGKKLQEPYFTSQGVYLFRAVNDDRDIYKERHWDKIPGRWLGVGEPETVFDPQVRRNELSNLKAKALWWKSKQVFWTADEIIARNLFNDVANGEVLRSKSGINPVQFNNSDLAAFKEEQDDWDENIKANTFSFDSQVGENLPSGTPYSLGALLAGKSGEFFAKKREELGLFISEIISDSVVPQFEKDKGDEHSFNFTDEEPEDRKHLIDLAVLVEAQTAIMDTFDKTGLIPGDAEVAREMESARARVLSRRGLFVKIKKDFYKNVKKHFDYVVTQEQIDLSANLTTLSNLLINLSKNPQALDDPRIGKILSVIMRKAGVSPVELGFDKQTASTIQQAGGQGLNALQPQPLPVGGNGAQPIGFGA